MFEEKIKDKEVILFLEKILKRFEIDVSYLSDEEFENSMNEVFDSLKYDYTKDYGKTKVMRKSVSIGNEVSQTIGLFYLYRIDNYAKIVLGFKYYGRYMDDILVISNSKEDLEKFLLYARSELLNLGLYINEKKTYIDKLSKGFVFLKTRFILTDTGKVIMYKVHDTFTRERRKLKKLSNKYENNELDYEYIKTQYSSWRGTVDRKKKINNIKTNKNMFKNKRQINKMDLLYNKLFENVINGESE